MKGENQNMESWRIGINKPIDDSLAVNQELQTVPEITNAGLATSGNYRNFYYKDGKNMRTPSTRVQAIRVQHNILSSTVVAKTVQQPMLYATSFMVLGLDSAKAICNAHPELDVYFIYEHEDGNGYLLYQWHEEIFKN